MSPTKIRNNVNLLISLCISSLLSLSLSGCVTTDEISTEEDLITKWSITTLAQQEIPKGLALTFQDDKRLAILGSCNRISSSYTVTKDNLTVGPVISTRKMCTPEKMAREQQLLKAVASFSSYQIEHNILTIFDVNKQIQIIAKRAKAQEVD